MSLKAISSLANAHPCLTLLLKAKSPETEPLIATFPCMPVWRASMILINLSMQLNFWRTCQRPNPRYSIKGLTEGGKYYVERPVLFSAFFLYLPLAEYHIYCTPSTPIPTLWFWFYFWCNMSIQAVQKHTRKSLANNWWKRNLLMVSTFFSVTFFKRRDYACNLPVLRYVLCNPNFPNQLA